MKGKRGQGKPRTNKHGAGAPTAPPPNPLHQALAPDAPKRGGKARKARC